MAEDDKKRYEKETEELKTLGYFVNKDGVKSTDIKPELNQFPKDTVMPKKAFPAYFHYTIETSKSLRASNSELKLTEIGKKVKEMWDQLTDAQKKKYDKLFETDKARYAKEVDHLRTHGYFINSEGVKSTDLVKKLTKGERAKAREQATKDKENAKIAKEKEDTKNAKS